MYIPFLKNENLSKNIAWVIDSWDTWSSRAWKGLQHAYKNSGDLLDEAAYTQAATGTARKGFKDIF